MDRGSRSTLGHLEKRRESSASELSVLFYLRIWLRAGDAKVFVIRYFSDSSLVCCTLLGVCERRFSKLKIVDIF